MDEWLWVWVGGDSSNYKWKVSGSGWMGGWVGGWEEVCVYLDDDPSNGEHGQAAVVELLGLVRVGGWVSFSFMYVWVLGR